MPATINASTVVSAAAAGSNFNYTVTLSNASSSSSGIGTFWYAWTPGQDYMASNPASVSPPSGWTDTVTHAGTGDGYAIQFVANSAANDVKPGSSLNFAFQSASTPSSVEGNSVDFPGTPVGTSVVYPGAPFSDGGHQFVVTAASSPTPTPTPTGTPTPTPAPTPSPTPAPTGTPTPAFTGKMPITTGHGKTKKVTGDQLLFSAPSTPPRRRTQATIR